MLKYLNYDNIKIDDELEKIKKCESAEIVVEPRNKKCLFILGMLFVNGVKIKILNEKELKFENANKSFTIMSYVWSKLGDDSAVHNYSDETKVFNERIKNAKENGTKVEPIKNNPIENKIFLICPVRNATPEQKEWIENFVKEKFDTGYIVHAPHLHTNQQDILGGYSICKQNAEAIASSNEIDIFYDQTSTGSVFDLGVAYALNKQLKLLNNNEITFDETDLIDKVISTWPFNRALKTKKLILNQSNN